jgi:hypothetical protein
MRTEEELEQMMAEKMADYEQPDDEQLAQFVAATSYSATYGEALNLIKTLPVLREQWLRAHKRLQEDIFIYALALDDAINDVVAILRDDLNG